MARYIDADELIKIGLQDGAYEYVSVDEIANFPTADVVERRENPIDAEEVYWHFKDVDGHKNLVIRLKGMFTDITDIRIRLDKYNLKELVKGEWIPIKTYWGESGGTYSIDGFKCSKCDRQEAYPSPFCPNCGAEMRGEEDERK